MRNILSFLAKTVIHYWTLFRSRRKFFIYNFTFRHTTSCYSINHNLLRLLLPQMPDLDWLGPFYPCYTTDILPLFYYVNWILPVLLLRPHFLSCLFFDNQLQILHFHLHCLHVGLILFSDSPLLTLIKQCFIRFPTLFFLSSRVLRLKCRQMLLNFQFHIQ